LIAQLENSSSKEVFGRINTILNRIYAYQNTVPKTLIKLTYQATNHSIDIKRMNKVLDYLRSHFTEDITLKTMAELAKMTPTSFSRYFKQKTGQTPMQLLYDLRINHACLLLRDTTYSLKEI